MVTRAIARYIRVSPRKTRKVIDLVRGMPVVKAEALLETLQKRPCVYIKRLLSSAIDSADKNSHLSPADLRISLIKADQGPMLKRYRAASMGRATMIRHRTSHITLELDRIKRPVESKKQPTVTEKKQTVKAKAPKPQIKKQKTATKAKKTK